ncbi:MAG: ECF transporter S component [bacterium]|nr:ECF transporter S component [bacterium]
MNPGLWATAAALMLVGWAFRRYERGGASSKEVALVACLAALAAIGRIPLAAFPAVQPTTFIVMLAGFVFGPGTGFLVGAFAAASSNMLLGHGPWTIWQMAAWGACGGVSGIAGSISPAAGRWRLAALGAFCGVLFGWTTNLLYWCAFVRPLDARTWIAVTAASLPFDIAHAAATAALALALGSGSVTALRYFRKRLVLSRATYYDAGRGERSCGS